MTSQRAGYLLGTVLLVLASLGGALSIVLCAGYAMYCVAFMHVPAAPVLMVTAVMLALSLGAFIAIGKLALDLRRTGRFPAA